jgi:chromodomain-helicase-DNA-binding protein 1
MLSANHDSIINPSHTNGHLHSPADDLSNIVMADLSESDLSEPSDPNMSALAIKAPIEDASKIQSYTQDDSAVSSDVDAEGSEDADFEMESPPMANLDAAMSSSDDSHKAPKRKAAASIEEDEHILNNPELYGIRRSVSRIPSR